MTAPERGHQAAVCSKTCLCHRTVVDWQRGTREPLAPAAPVWTPGGRR